MTRPVRVGASSVAEPTGSPRGDGSAGASRVQDDGGGTEGIHPTPGKLPPKEDDRGAIALIERWIAADWPADTGEMEELKRRLNANRPFGRRLFPEVAPCGTTESETGTTDTSGGR